MSINFVCDNCGKTAEAGLRIGHMTPPSGFSVRSDRKKILVACCYLCSVTINKKEMKEEQKVTLLGTDGRRI